MPQIITLYSYRGGTGKTSTAANMAYLMAAGGLRVGVVDTNLHSPAVEAMFGISGYPGQRSLADYLLGRCEIEDAAYPFRVPGTGCDIYLVTGRIGTAGVDEILERGYDVGLLGECFDRLINILKLDFLVLDTHAGFNNETLTAVARSDTLIIMARPDRLDLTGAGEMVSLTGRLGRTNRLMVVNMAPGGRVPSDLKESLETTYESVIITVLPYSPEASALAGEQLFAVADPAHPLVAGYRHMISRISRVKDEEAGRPQADRVGDASSGVQL